MRIFLSMAVIVSAIWLTITVMIYGWGLEPQSWFIIIGGSIGSVILAGISTILASGS